MRVFIIVILTFMSTVAVEKGGFGGFKIGLLMPEVSEINKHFRNHQVSELSGNLIGMGGGGFAIVDRVLVGGNGYVVKETAESDSVYSELSISAGTFKLGYSIIAGHYFNGLLNIGFGRANYTLGLRPIMADVQFDSLLSDPGRYVDLTAGHFLLNPEAMFIFSIPVKSFAFFHIGISGGANINVFNPEWKYDGKKVFDGPEIGTVTPVLNVYFLFGGGV